MGSDLSNIEWDMGEKWKKPTTAVWSSISVVASRRQSKTNTNLMFSDLPSPIAGSQSQKTRRMKFAHDIFETIIMITEDGFRKFDQVAKCARIDGAWRKNENSVESHIRRKHGNDEINAWIDIQYAYRECMAVGLETQRSNAKESVENK